MKLNAPRKAIVVIATVLVVGYCLAILIHVNSSTCICLQCTFASKVARVYPEFIRSSNSPELIGATITRVGPHYVENWPDYLRALRELQASVPADGSDPTFARHGDENWVQVELQQQGQAKPVTLLCRLGHTPLETTLPAVLWLILEVGLFVVGALVFWLRPEDRSAGPFFGLTIVAVGAYLGGYHWSQLATHPVLLSIFVISAMLLSAVTLHFYQVFPRPKPWFERRPRVTLAAVYGWPLAMALLIVAGYFWIRGLARSNSPAEEVRQAMSALRVVIFLSFAVAAAWFTAGVGCLVHGFYRATEAVERSQVKWMLAGS